MLNSLKKYNNLGSPNYFFHLFKTMVSNENSLTADEINTLFYNKIIDDNSIFDGCLPLISSIKIVNKIDKTYYLDNNFSNYLNSISQMKDKFIEYLFRALKEDDTIYSIFNPKYLSYDVVYKSIQISKNAFGFKYSNFRELLLQFNVLTPHPHNEFNHLIFNNRYKKLLDKTILPKIKEKKLGIEELRKLLEKKNVYGEEAEKFVFDFERKRLENKEIDWVAKYIANEGYDIASYNEKTDDIPNRFIEVKSYNGNIPYFYWSQNELKIARIKKDKYWIYLVNREKINIKDYEPLMIQNPYETILKNNDWEKSVDKYRIKKIN